MQYSFTPGPLAPVPSPPPYTESDHRGQHVPGRDPDFWFEDGNVIVIADTISFRIHRSVLARHSDILADRLGSDHRDAHGDVNTTDGCPVIHVADSAKSFKGFLSLLYPGPSEILRHVTSGDRALTPRVTHKYLSGLLPSTFDEWKRREDRGALPSSSGHASTHSNSNSDRIAILNAIRQIHADDLVPIALYLCAQLPPRVLLSGQRRSDGSVEKLGSTDDVERCLRLRADMAQRSARMAMRLFADALDPRCRGRCRAAVEEMFFGVVGGEFEDASRTDPLGAYWRRHVDAVERGAKGDKRVCARCADVLRERDEGQRRELWDELPRLVGF